MPELITEGVTGSVVTDVEAAAKVAGALDQFDRSMVRASAVERFSADRMVDEYVAAYGRVIAEPRPPIVDRASQGPTRAFGSKTKVTRTAKGRS